LVDDVIQSRVEGMRGAARHNLLPGRNASSKLTHDVARSQEFHAAFNLGDPAAATLWLPDDASGADHFSHQRGRRIVPDEILNHGLR
jgi:hypothetical protein